MAETEKPTYVDGQSDFEGNLKGKDAHILGRFRGQIELTGRLILGEGSRVDAKVVADSAEIAGEFKGELKVRSLILLEKGRLEGNLETQSLAVRDGAQLNGAVNAGIGKATTVRQAVTTPPAPAPAPGNVATG